jgi:hypothetical protein
MASLRGFSDLSQMLRTVHRPNLIVALALVTATLASLGPHMLMLGYKLADAQPPAALLFLCPLHRVEGISTTSRLVLHAKPYRGQSNPGAAR